MGKKLAKISKKKAFEKIFRSGRFLSGKYLSLKYLKNQEGLNRSAVVVSNKVSKKAVERNKIKRRLRQIIRLNCPKNVQSFDLVVMAKTFALKAKYEDLEKELIGLLNKI